MPALPAIQADLDTTPSAAAWLLTGYLLSASVVTPIAGRLGDMFGKRRMLAWALSIFALGLLMGGLASSIEMLILARVAQGFGGALFPLAFGIIRDEFPADRAAQGIAFMSALLGVGGGLGVVIAGPIVSSLGYHWIFWPPLALVLCSIAGTVLLVPESRVKTPSRVDWTGAVLLSLWLTAILLGISRSSDWGWTDPWVLGLGAAGGLLAAAWVRHEVRVPAPLIDIALARKRSVWTVHLAGFLVGASMYGVLLLYPNFTEAPTSTGYGFGASITEAGLFILPLAAMVLVGGSLAGWLNDRVGPRTTLVIGALLSAVAFLGFVGFHDRPIDVYVSAGLQGAGVGLSFASLANLVVAAVPARQVSEAMGVNTVSRTLGGSLSTQICATVLAGSAVSGFASAEGFNAAFAFLGLVSVLACLTALGIPRLESRPPAWPRTKRLAGGRDSFPPSRPPD